MFSGPIVSGVPSLTPKAAVALLGPRRELAVRNGWRVGKTHTMSGRFADFAVLRVGDDVAELGDC